MSFSVFSSLPQKLFSRILLVGLLFLMPACSEVQYAAHLIKQVPFAKENAKNQGTFKVGTPYKINGRYYYPKESYDLEETGIASWYGPKFHGKQTANGEIFDQEELTAAHRTLQMPSLIRVTNLENGNSLILRVNDRGPYSRGRILDVSKRGAELLGFKNQGTAKIRLQVLEEESKQIAEVAKQGVDTGGYEVALNSSNVQPASGQVIEAANQSSSRPISVLPGDPQAVSQNDIIARAPAPEVQVVPVVPSDIYVQAAAFSQQNNALQYTQALQNIGPAKVYNATVNGKEFFRVRFGPFEEVAQADRVLESVIASGNNDALIVVD